MKMWRSLVWLLLVSMMVAPGAAVHVQEALAQEAPAEESPVMKVNPDEPSAAADSKAADADALGTAASATAADSSGKKFTGSPITLKMKDADINEVLRLISDASGFNIVLNPAVKGTVTVSLENVPWDQALEVVMTTLNLAADRNDSVLRVMPRDMLIKQKQDEIDNQKLADQSAPRITRVFPLSYSEPSKLQALLKDYLSSQADKSQGIAAKVMIDDNTQSLIVQDTQAGLERVKKIIKLLDVQTPQVIIEAKVVDATESFSSSIDGKFQIDVGRFSGAINGGLAGAGAGGGSSGGTGTANNSGLNAFKFGIGSSLTLNALLNFSEGESKAKVISTPKVIVLSGKPARIVQGSNLAVKQVTQANGVTVETTTFVPYSTSLNITPRATNDGSVLMKLELSRDTVVTDQNGQASVAPRNINTELIVDSGNTLVIGGVQSSTEVGGSSGFPFLRKIPLIGWLFGKENSSSDRTELMFFVTPRILNVKRTAIGDGSDVDRGSRKL